MLPARQGEARSVPRGSRLRLTGDTGRLLSVSRDRIEVRFRGAQDAVGRLFALAQALTHDYEQFEALVEEGDAGRGGGAGRA